MKINMLRTNTAPPAHDKVRRLNNTPHYTFFIRRGNIHPVDQGAAFFKFGNRTQPQKTLFIKQGYLFGPLNKNFGKGKVCQSLIQSRNYIHISNTNDAGNSGFHNSP